RTRFTTFIGKRHIWVKTGIANGAAGIPANSRLFSDNVLYDLLVKRTVASRLASPRKKDPVDEVGVVLLAFDEQRELVLSVATGRPDVERALLAADWAVRRRKLYRVVDRIQGPTWRFRNNLLAPLLEEDTMNVDRMNCPFVVGPTPSRIWVVRTDHPTPTPFAYNGNSSAISRTFPFTRCTVASSRFTNTSSINSATRSISCTPNPRVVSAGVPRRMPLVTNGDCGSPGIVFLLTVIAARSSSCSASF